MMSYQVRCVLRRPNLLLTAALAALFGISAPAAEDRPGGPQAPSADRPAAASITLPQESDDATIQAFVQQLVQGFQTRTAEHRSLEGTNNYLNAIEGALSQLQTRKLEEPSAALVAQVRMQVLDILLQNEAANVVPRMQQLAGLLAKSEYPPLRQLGAQYATMVEIRSVGTLPPEGRAKLVDKIVAQLKAPQMSRESIGYAQTLAEELEYADQYAEAAAAYTAFAKAVESRQEPQFAELVEMMKSSARRVGLMGNPIDIRGTTVEGKPFNIADWKGKVVLVDFWATWCGPCVGELPNVKQNYALYHSKGFEVIGISLDENPEDLTAFLEREKISWPTLFPAKQEERGWNNPLARYYGISGIPAVFLVNQEGKVVSLDARGEELGLLLAKLLGPAPANGGVTPPQQPTR